MQTNASESDKEVNAGVHLYAAGPGLQDQLQDVICTEVGLRAAARLLSGCHLHFLWIQLISVAV